MTGRELVLRAMERSGAKSPGELARLLGLESYSSPGRVRRWIEGKGEPDFQATVRLVELAELPEGAATVTSISRGVDPERLSEMLVEQHERYMALADKQAAFLDQLVEALIQMRRTAKHLGIDSPPHEDDPPETQAVTGRP